VITIDRGSMTVLGNRYTIRPGQITFSNPSHIEPYFDVQADTKLRLGTQTYDVTFRITGTFGRSLSFTPSSDPYLSTNDLLLALLGQEPIGETKAGRSPQLSQQQLISTAAAQLLTAPVTSTVGRVVQRTIPFDTFSVVPLLGTEAISQTGAGARVTLGKRLSDRVFLTYSRALNAPQYVDVVLLEYEQSDRVSWVLSRNEDRTFALDFRIRHIF
jgi:autotransporter translocation and assembly factor TamB